MRRLLATSAFIVVIGSLVSWAAPATAVPARECTAANGQICDFGHWDIYNHTWGPTPGTYVIHAHSQGNWTLTADQNGGGNSGCNGCAVEAYESSQWNYAGNGMRYSSIKYLSSTFSETMPTGTLKRNGFDAEAAFDMFIHGSDTDEVMVWVDNQGQTPAGFRDGSIDIHGQRFEVWVSGGTKSFVLRKNETKGTIDYFAILRWMHNHGMLASSDTLWQFNFGWEVCDTAGRPQSFTVHSLTLHQKF
jgi:hypothetical protein